MVAVCLKLGLLILVRFMEEVRARRVSRIELLSMVSLGLRMNYFFW